MRLVSHGAELIRQRGFTNRLFLGLILSFNAVILLTLAQSASAVMQFAHSHARANRSLSPPNRMLSSNSLLQIIQHSLFNHSAFEFFHYPALHSDRKADIKLQKAGKETHINEREADSIEDNVAFDLFVSPTPQSQSSKIVFASNRDGSMQIYLMNSDGSGQVRLTSSGANDDYPRWSPSGANILFQSDRDHPDTGYMDVYVMNSDGSGVTRLTVDANDDSMATWSPDGSKIVFQSMRNGMNYQVYSMNVDGSNQVNLTNSSSSDGEPAWSPNGTQIAFDSDRDHSGYDSIYVMNSDGSNQHAITFNSGNVEDTQPFWSPDAGKIAFVSTRDSVLETWQETDDDGNIITKSTLHLNKEIYVMIADGSGQTRLTNELANDDSPSWSPDGSKIVFRSDRERDCCDPSAQVWTMNADGTGLANISNSGNGDYSASWTSGNSCADCVGLDSHPGNQPPVANPGGPYNSQSGQVVQLNGSGSFDPNGTIVSYSWGFGDGTSGSGPIVNHQYNASGVYSVSLSVSDNNGSTASSPGFVTVDSVALPVKINFDELPNNTLVADQYLNQSGVRFYSNNLFAPTHIWQTCGFCSTTSPPSFLSTKPDDAAALNVEFTKPVSNLTFFMIGVDAFFNQFAVVDVYRNGALSSTFPVFGNGTFTVGISLGTLDNISKIVVRGINDPAGIGFDDFSFNVPVDINITNPRATGSLNGTTKDALLGADVTLNAAPTLGAFAGGTYAWTFTGPYSISGGGPSSPSITLRSTDLGTAGTSKPPITATITYRKNGLTASGSLTINSVLPTLTNFTAQQGNGTVTQPGSCNSSDSFWWYGLGCIPPQDIGIHFSTGVHAPTFISDPSQSGIKYVQAVSTLRKRIERGLRCVTKRSDELNIESGWQLDTVDPYDPGGYPSHRFSEGNDLTMLTVDYPKSLLTFLSSYEFRDSLYVDDQFVMYVVYFTIDPKNPPIQKPLGRLRWNWGGLVVFDWNGSDAVHTLRFTNAVAGTRTGEPTDSMVTMQGVVSKADVPCPNGPALTNNKIDSSRYFVRQHYLDFLGRDPLGDSTHPPDPVGWNFWTSGMSQCVFELNCIHSKRIQTGLAFFYSGEFIQTDPGLANPPGTPGFDPAVYNRRFVFWCYKKYLGKEPDPEGWQFWTDVLNTDGDYAHTIEAFQVCGDYRDRPGFH